MFSETILSNFLFPNFEMEWRRVFWIPFPNMYPVPVNPVSVGELLIYGDSVELEA